MPNLIPSGFDDDPFEFAESDCPSHDMTSKPHNGGIHKVQYSTRPTKHAPKFSANGGDISTWKKERRK